MFTIYKPVNFSCNKILRQAPIKSTIKDKNFTAVIEKNEEDASRVFNNKHFKGPPDMLRF